MLHFFRNFFSSKLGVIVTMSFLVLIGLAFASADVTGSKTFGGVAGGDRAASVGSAKIGTGALGKAVSSAVENMKQENPRLSMKAFLAEGGLEKVLDEMISRTAIEVFGVKHGMIAGDRLIDSEIAKIPSFRGPDGKFSDAAYHQALQQRGLDDAMVREDLGQGLVAKQVLVPASFGAVAPHELVMRYSGLIKEHRSGSIGLLPAAAFAPKTPPTDAELTAYYAKHQNNYIRPERRVIRYATFDDSALKNIAAPTDAEIAARYNANKTQYAASETRKIAQLVMPTEAGAKAVLAELAKGTSLEAAATSKGLSVATLTAMSKSALTTQSSTAVADAVFAAPKGRIAGPVRSGLGWHLMRIDEIETKAERPLASVKGELTAQIAVEKRRNALVDFSARIEDEFDNGGNLADVAKELSITPALTQSLTADGKVYGKPGEAAPAAIATLIPTAFAMERENEPQLAEVVPGKTFMIFDVTSIEPSTAAPLAEIKGQIAADVMLEKGAFAAKLAVDRVLAAVRKGSDLGAAMSALGIALPPVDQVNMGREQLAQQGQQVPPPLALLFSMAQGTVKPLKAPGNRGWFIVALKHIEPGQMAANDPQLPQLQRGLSGETGREYAEQLRRAIRAEVGVTRNENAIKSVGTQLSGGN
jgi:peptidyl-prolyl cis-trans isomerase D